MTGLVSLYSIPNLLTLLRIVMIPLFAVSYYLPYRDAHIMTTFIFVLAALTDWLDGYLARRLDQSSPFGAFLDPVADKLMVSSALILLLSDAAVHTLLIDDRLFAIVVIIIIGREIAISALREWMAKVGKRSSVAVTYIGKFKTIAQMVAISFLLFKKPLLGIPVFTIGEIILYIAAFLTLYSMVEHLKTALRELEGPYIR